MSEPVFHPVRPLVPGVREVLRAHFPAGSHAYPMHTHDTWTLMVVDSGAVVYHLDRVRQVAPRTAVTLLPPHVPHDGRAATAAGFHKRVVYLEADVLEGLPLDAVLARPLDTDPALVAEVAGLHDDLVRALDAADRTAAEERLALLAVDGLPLREAASAMGTTAPALVRAFRAEVGMTPHRYLVARRLDLARRHLLAGSSVADAAAASGFFDQAHLTRHFRRYLGVAPGAYARAVH